MTETDVRAALCKAVASLGTITVAAEAIGISRSYLHDVMKGKRGIPDDVLTYLKLRRDVQYRRVA